MTKLRDGSEVADPRLGRLIQFDERSREFPIRALVGANKPRSYTWSVGAWLDQLSEGSCVGHAFAHELIARPVKALGIDHEYARNVYFDAQKIDPWPGGAYLGAQPQYEGTSVLAGAKVCQERGHFESYKWAFGLNDLILALGYAGPAVLGLNWYRDMAETEYDGRIRPRGQMLGGHAILAYKVQVTTKHRSVPKVWFHNSWSERWGINGRCYLTFDDLGRLLDEQGEACIPTARRKVT